MADSLRFIGGPAWVEFHPPHRVKRKRSRMVGEVVAVMDYSYAGVSTLVCVCWDNDPKCERTENIPTDNLILVGIGT